MKIKIIDASTKKPVINSQVKLQVEGQEGKTLTHTTDQTGMIDLDGSLQGKKIGALQGGKPGQYVKAEENAVLLVQQQTTKA